MNIPTAEYLAVSVSVLPMDLGSPPPNSVRLSACSGTALHTRALMQFMVRHWDTPQ